MISRLFHFRSLHVLRFLMVAACCGVAAATGFAATVSGTQAVAGTFGNGTTVIYTVVLANSGTAQADNPGNEFSEVLPVGVTIVSATATSGTAVATVGANTVTWNGGVPGGGSVTITITATVAAAVGQTVSAQGAIAYDADGNGTNEATALTDDPGVNGLNATVFTVRSALVSGTQTATGNFIAGGAVTYTVQLHNTGTGAQADNAGDEFLESLPAQLAFGNASASAGTITTTEDSDVGSTILSWNGAIPAGGTVTITIHCTVLLSAGGQILNAQGIINFDADLNGGNESSTLTDDPAVGGAQDANTATISSALIYGAQSVAGRFVPGATAIYTVTLTNSGTGAQLDNAGPEFEEIFPAAVTVFSATANAGVALFTPATNTARWDGSVPAGGSVVITIRATIAASANVGDVISAQGDVHYDFSGAGTNDQTIQTYQPPLGEEPQPTTFTVRDFRDFAFFIGKKASSFAVLENDVAEGAAPAATISAKTDGQFGTVTINPNGTLSYLPSTTFPARGQDTFTYTVNDGAGGSYTETVTVHALADAAATYNGLLQPDGTGKTFENSGLLKCTVGKTGAFTGAITVAGKKFSFSGKMDTLGNARFGRVAARELVLKRTAPRGQAVPPELLVSFEILPTTDLDLVTATVTDAGNPVASATADRAFYTAKKNPALPLVNLPAGVAGKYTVEFPPVAPLNHGLGATEYPQGFGFGTLTIAPSGVATVKGTLADGTPISYANALARDLRWPIYIQLYKSKGALTGLALVRPLPGSDLDGSNLAWFRPFDAKAKLYADGWPNPGISINLLGSTFKLPDRGVVQSLLPGLGATSPTGNADFTASGGDVPAPLALSVNIDPKNKTAFIAPPAGLLPKVTITSNGLVTGSFIHPDTQKKVTLRGVILQKLERIDGYFLGPDASGPFRLEPK
jgi:uncharacterized repeat protein (TIGR01451 family)